MNLWSQDREPRTVVRVEPPVLIALIRRKHLKLAPSATVSLNYPNMFMFGLLEYRHSVANVSALLYFYKITY